MSKKQHAIAIACSAKLLVVDVVVVVVVLVFVVAIGHVVVTDVVATVDALVSSFTT